MKETMLHPYFPYKEPLKMDDIICSSIQILQALKPWLTEQRANRIEQVIEGRTYTITPVLDGLYDIGNINAVLRTSEALGFQSVHVIETSVRYREANRVAQGAEKWLDIFRWKNTTDCISYLKNRKYKIYTTTFDSARPIQEIDFLEPTAIVFGNEHQGVSKEIINEADERVFIPMYGFTQSFNISVAAAITLYHAFSMRTTKLKANGDLYENEKQILKAIFYFKSLPNAKHILTHELKRQNKKEPINDVE
ncbi:MAG TPA: RNA methyltransferase [Candidatus Hydrogenedens sp.]|nr:RNA methyltransferase [Candidatus Hydrogenedens sp.]HOK10112.1 RNA methyltransferase [Candidatus Hydrogenedens sp.]HOL20069.1 RNA methyltransferase [Candidatus Hydrogenedens sp.]HPP59660.1 RNA methyltransferase [Candidatus Hydrogenedens sp.]